MVVERDLRRKASSKVRGEKETDVRVSKREGSLRPLAQLLAALILNENPLTISGIKLITNTKVLYQNRLKSSLRAKIDW